MSLLATVTGREDLLSEVLWRELAYFSIFQMFSVVCMDFSNGSHRMFPQSGSFDFLRNSNSITFQQFLGLDSINRRCSDSLFFPFDIDFLLDGSYVWMQLKSGSPPSSDKSA